MELSQGPRLACSFLLKMRMGHKSRTADADQISSGFSPSLVHSTSVSTTTSRLSCAISSRTNTSNSVLCVVA
ncbi:hypothetical protein GLOTRDRAFT_111919 [Gloeophyllum trabeum ATCC 11539]|uniref:Uncharacterized protein n=1 Tax=Gloeophyllum trabeum (strain ATCC 11539 / FP-39264 / Madison 617) TaxID=670483 RepID=S7Q0L3_GLOTA|nr:uncharacterized protein GLOTRDRAFT_111919 [Gloeophyllum trabeum ATCC 11539]EPQ53273.1 hypothetical protein GLOTRDRAFT_111919 [Gloeophyllum trabeum ATCC 11539]